MTSSMSCEKIQRMDISLLPEDSCGQHLRGERSIGTSTVAAFFQEIVHTFNKQASRLSILHLESDNNEDEHYQGLTFI
jgi:hypothetical protein